MEVGQVVEADVGPLAAGGHCVARHDGQVIFVRGVLPGERVRLRVTEVTRRLARAVPVEILDASPDRVVPPCPVAGECGGCDFQHIAPDAQRSLKAVVLAEQLQRLGGIDWSGVIEPVEPMLGGRTRMRFTATGDGRLGLRAHRSHQVVPLPSGGCRLAHPEMPTAGRYEPGEWLGSVSVDGGAMLAPADPTVLTQDLGRRRFQVAANGFWQAHSAAPATLTGAVLEALAPRPGERALDLYCGVGLFSAALVDQGCTVIGVEGSRTAVDLARRNVPEARFLAGDVARVLARLREPTDLVVLDPPRAGAGRAVMQDLAQRRPRRIAYVSCDPATLARDLRVAVDAGLSVDSLRAFDVFPMTHHVECVAVLSSQSDDPATTMVGKAGATTSPLG